MPFIYSANCLIATIGHSIFCFSRHGFNYNFAYAGNPSVNADDSKFGAYKEESLDLDVKVSGGTIRVWRNWLGDKNQWKINAQHDAIKLDGSIRSNIVSRAVPTSITRGGRLYVGENFYARYHRDAVNQDIGLARLIQQAIGEKNVQSCNGPYDRGEGFVVTNGGFKYITGTDHSWTEYNADGKFLQWGVADQRIGIMLYDTTGKVRGYADTNGQEVITYVRDTAGNIKTATDYTGRTVTYQYNNQNLLTQVTKPDGANTFYQYDDRKNITLITNGEGADAIQNTLTYFDDSTLKSYIDGEGRGANYTYQYSASDKAFIETKKLTGGRIITTYMSQDGEGYRRLENNVLTFRAVRICDDYVTVDRHNRVTYFDRDMYGRLNQILYPDGSTYTFQNSSPYWPNLDKSWNEPHDKSWGIVQFNNAAGLQIAYTRDLGGRVTQAVEAQGTSAQRTWRFTYDDKGNLLTRRLLFGADPDDNKDTVDNWRYDGYGNITSYTNSSNGTWRFEHNAQGNITKIIEPNNAVSVAQYSDVGRLIYQKTPSNLENFYEYSQAGFLKSFKETYDTNVQAVSNYSYDRSGLLTMITDPLQNQWKYQYDLGGNRVAATDPENNTKSWTYTKEGRVLTATDETGVTVSYEYLDTAPRGELGQPQTPYAPGVIEVYPTLVKETDYDMRDNIVKEIITPSTGDVLTTNFTYDTEGRVLSTTLPDGRLTSYNYDVLGRTTDTSSTGWGQSHIQYTDVGRHVTLTNSIGGTYEQIFNRAGDLESDKRFDGTQNKYAYDQQRRLLQTINPNQQVTKYGYDDASRVTTINRFQSLQATTPDDTVQFGYNFRSDLLSYANASVTTNMTVDAFGRTLTSATNFGDFTKSHQYSYSPKGNRLTYTTPDGTNMAYTWNKNGTFAWVTIPNEGIITYRYNPRDWKKPASILFPGGTTQTTTYDDLERIKEIQAKDRHNYMLLDNVYSFLPNSYDIAQKISVEGTYTYGWDSAHRVTDIGAPTAATTEHFSYDTLGNRQTVSDVTAGRPWQYTLDGAVTSGGGITYGYDANGNRSSETGSNTQKIYGYSIDDKLTKFESPPGTVVATYGYDGLGQRTLKNVGGVKTYFYYTEDGLAAEFDGVGNQVRSYLYEPGKDWQLRPLAMKNNAGYFYYLTDHLNTPQKLIDKNGYVAWAASGYKVYGEAVVSLEQIVNPLRLPGQYFDAESGLNQNYMRSYDPKVGGYTNQDPVGVWRTGANRFGYVGGNPVGIVDPKGRDPISLTIGGPVIIIAAPVLAEIIVPVVVAGVVVYVGYEVYEHYMQQSESLEEKTPGAICKEDALELSCPSSRLNELRAEKRKLCNTKSCKWNDSEEALKSKIEGHLACVKKREQITLECYYGIPEEKHTGEEEIRRKLAWECEEILYSEFGKKI